MERKNGIEKEWEHIKCVEASSLLVTKYTNLPFFSSPRTVISYYFNEIIPSLRERSRKDYNVDCVRMETHESRPSVEDIMEISLTHQKDTLHRIVLISSDRDKLLEVCLSFARKHRSKQIDEYRRRKYFFKDCEYDGDFDPTYWVDCKQNVLQGERK